MPESDPPPVLLADLAEQVRLLTAALAALTVGTLPAAEAAAGSTNNNKTFPSSPPSSPPTAGPSAGSNNNNTFPSSPPPSPPAAGAAAAGSTNSNNTFSSSPSWSFPAAGAAAGSTFSSASASSPAAAGAGAAAGPGGPLSESDRTALALRIGDWVRGRLAGKRGTASGRDTNSLQSQVYIVFRDWSGSACSPVTVFRSWAATSQVVRQQSTFGNSVFIGFPTEWEARLAVQAAQCHWPALP